MNNDEWILCAHYLRLYNVYDLFCDEINELSFFVWRGSWDGGSYEVVDLSGIVLPQIEPQLPLTHALITWKLKSL